MFPCSSDREGRAVSLVYSELTSSPVSVTCGSLLKGKAQTFRRPTTCRQGICCLCVPVTAVSFACVCMCVCASGFSLQRRRDSPDTRETEARSTQHLPGSTTGTGRAVAGFPGLFPSRGASHMSSHTAPGEGVHTTPGHSVSAEGYFENTHPCSVHTPSQQARALAGGHRHGPSCQAVSPAAPGVGAG